MSLLPIGIVKEVMVRANRWISALMVCNVVDLRGVFAYKTLLFGCDFLRFSDSLQ